MACRCARTCGFCAPESKPLPVSPYASFETNSKEEENVTRKYTRGFIINMWELTAQKMRLRLWQNPSQFRIETRTCSTPVVLPCQFCISVRKLLCYFYFQVDINLLDARSVLRKIEESGLTIEDLRSIIRQQVTPVSTTTVATTTSLVSCQRFRQNLFPDMFGQGSRLRRQNRTLLTSGLQDSGRENVPPIM